MKTFRLLSLFYENLGILSFLKVSGFIDEAILARIDQKYHKNRFERRLDF